MCDQNNSDSHNSYFKQNKIPQDSSYILGVDRDMSSKLLYLETEVRVKKEEIATLKEQVWLF